ncbi:MAG: hypothetical protein HY010_19530 [Acidobacteria bacterium]|nr:hypothetical protein [Acidobacteriota bacterium]
MILVVTPNLAVDESFATLQQATKEKIVLAKSLVEAATLLRAESYLAVVLDQYLLETEPHNTEVVMRHLGTAIPLQFNFAISGVARLVREVRATVDRRQREEESARRAAVNTLQSETNGTVTALLLCCELAMGAPGISSTAFKNIESAHELVKKLRDQLESSLTEA